LKSPSKILQNKLYSLRKLYGLTQEEVAIAAGIDYKRYQFLETAPRINPTFSTLQKLAKAFKIEVWELLHVPGSTGNITLIYDEADDNSMAAAEPKEKKLKPGRPKKGK